MSLKIFALAIAAVLTLPGDFARAEDLKVLTRVLYAADLADQANTFCALSDPSFPEKTKGSLGYMRFYAEHIKVETTSNLRQVDAFAVLKMAADKAKEEMLFVLRDIRKSGPGSESHNISVWCNQVAFPLITDVIRTHDGDHKELEKILAKAKAK